MSFFFFKQVLDFLNALYQRSAHYVLWAKSILVPIFVNKILLEHSQAICLCIFLGTVYVTMAVVSITDTV